jgi:hypothetical protein
MGSQLLEIRKSLVLKRLNRDTRSSDFLNPILGVKVGNEFIEFQQFSIFRLPEIWEA